MNAKRPYYDAARLMAGLSCLLETMVGAATYERNLEKTFDAAPGGVLIIQADRGSVEVTTEGTQVRVQVLREVKGGTQAQADELFANHEVTFHQEGNTVSVIARNKKDSFKNWSGRPGLQVRYQVSLPTKFSVDLQTAGGNIQVGPLEGTAAARTSSGSIDLKRVSGRIISPAGFAMERTGEKRSGLLQGKLNGGGPALVLRASSGDIQIKEAAQTVTALEDEPPAK